MPLINGNALNVKHTPTPEIFIMNCRINPNQCFYTGEAMQKLLIIAKPPYVPAIINALAAGFSYSDFDGAAGWPSGKSKKMHKEYLFLCGLIESGYDLDSEMPIIQ